MQKVLPPPQKQKRKAPKPSRLFTTQLPPLAQASNLLAVGGEGTSEAALAEVVLDRTLLGSS
jgi:hypothetical protein